MPNQCKSLGCINEAMQYMDFCPTCQCASYTGNNETTLPLSKRYPGHYRSVEGMTEIDVYSIHHLFAINDASGCIQHASKKLLLSGVNKTQQEVYNDILEARDTLSRWLELNK